MITSEEIEDKEVKRLLSLDIDSLSKELSLKPKRRNYITRGLSDKDILKMLYLRNMGMNILTIEKLFKMMDKTNLSFEDEVRIEIKKELRGKPK